MKVSRNNGLDLLRVISSFAVVLLHVNAYFLFSEYDVHNNMLVIENIINMITRFCVPCFVMISGMFILDNKNNKDMNLFYKKSFSKIGIPYIGVACAWIILLFVWRVIINNDIAAFIRAIVKGNYGNLWFMLMLIGLYLITPFLIRMVDTLTRKELSVMSVIFIIWAIISQPFSSFELPYSMGVVAAFGSYFLLGFALKDVSFSTQKKIGGGIVCIVLLLLSLYSRISGFELYMESPYTAFFDPAVVILSVYVFLFFRDLKFPNIRNISDVTYYIYLLHTPVYMVLCEVFENCKLNQFCSIAVITILTFVLSFILGQIYKIICKRVAGRFLK